MSLFVASLSPSLLLLILSLPVPVCSLTFTFHPFPGPVALFNQAIWNKKTKQKRFCNLRCPLHSSIAEQIGLTHPGALATVLSVAAQTGQVKKRKNKTTASKGTNMVAAHGWRPLSPAVLVPTKRESWWLKTSKSAARPAYFCQNPIQYEGVVQSPDRIWSRPTQF